MASFRMFENPKFHGRKDGSQKAVAINFDRVTRVNLYAEGSVSVHFDGDPSQEFLGDTAAEVWLAWQEFATV